MMKKKKKKKWKKEINKKIRKNWEGIHIEILNEKEIVINFLLDNNIDLDIQDSEGDPAFHLALK